RFDPPPRIATDDGALSRSAAASSSIVAGVTVGTSEDLAEPGRLHRMHAGTATRPLAAQPRRREHLARVAQTIGIERAAHVLHDVEIRGAEHPAHVLLLVVT